MPVQKFKTFEEAEKALWNFKPDDAYLARIAELWDFATKLNPISYPKGIFKFKTIEEANKQTSRRSGTGPGKKKNGEKEPVKFIGTGLSTKKIKSFAGSRGGFSKEPLAAGGI